MLLINFICLFYLMVLVRCDTISKSAANTKSFHDISDAFEALYSRQDVPDPASRSPTRLPRLRKQKRPWLYTVPINSYLSTDAMEDILDSIKYKNMKQIASSPFGTTGMIFVTQPGYDVELSGLSTAKPNLPDKIDADDTTTELDELIYIDNLRIKEPKNKRRAQNEETVSDKLSKKKVNKKSSFKDFFKFLHPKGRVKGNQDPLVSRGKQDPLKEAPVLPKDEIKPNFEHEDKTENILSRSIGIISNVSKKIQSYRSNKEKTQQNIRYQRSTDTESQEDHKWLFNFIKRDPHSQAFDSRVYETLSQKLAYKDFVDGYKYYLKFEKDMAKSNFSDLVRYQAHKHHNVDDIGKFILEKLPSVATTISYESKPSDQLPLEDETDNPMQMDTTYNLERLNESADYDINLEKYDYMETTNVPSSSYPLNMLKKRLIDIRRPSWLRKSINSYSGSSTQSPRVKRHGIRFDKTQFPHSLKTDRPKPKETAKNVGFAKVTLVEAVKTKKPYKSLFEKFKKHHSKREQRESRSSFINKLKQLFANGQTTSTKRAVAGGYDFPSHFYEIMKDQYPFYKATETSDIWMDDKMKKPLPQSHINRFSISDYERDPNRETTMFSANFHVGGPEIPFELTTPVVQDPELRKELHKLQQAYDTVSSKLFDAEYDLSSKSTYQFLSTTDSFEPLNLKELEAKVNNARNWTKVTPTSKYTSTLPSLTSLEDLESYDDAKDLLKSSHEQGENFGRKGPDTQPTPQHTTKSWEIDYPEFKEQQSSTSWQINETQSKSKLKGSESFQRESEFINKLKSSLESWQNDAQELKNKPQEHHSPKGWQKNDPGIKNKQTQYQSSKQSKERHFKNNLKDLSQTWQTNDLKLKSKQEEHRLSKIGQKNEENLKKNLKGQTPSKSWKTTEPEFKNEMTDYDLDTKPIFPSTPEKLKLLNKANPDNHFNIKPSMYNKFSIDEMVRHVTDSLEKPNATTISTDKMPIGAEKSPEFGKAMKDIVENWLKTPVVEVKTNKKMPGNTENRREHDKKLKAMREMGFRVRDSSETHNTGVVNKLKSKVTAVTKEDINNKNDEYYMKDDDDGLDEKQKKTIDQSKKILDGVALHPNGVTEDDRRHVTSKLKTETNDDYHSKLAEQKVLIHNKLLYDTVPHVGANHKVENAKAIQTSRKFFEKTISQKAGDKTSKGTGEVSQKQSWPLHPQSTVPNNIYDSEFRRKLFDFDITTAKEKTTVDSVNFGPLYMLDKFDLEFPEFTIEGKLAVLVKEWFEKNYPDLLKISEHNKGKYPADGLSDIGRLIKNWLEKQDMNNTEMATKALVKKNPNSREIETSVINGKNTDIEKPDKTIDIGSHIMDWLDKFDPESAKLKAGKEMTNLKKMAETTTIGVGRLVKDWLDSFDPDCAKTTTTSVNTRKNNKFQTAKHMVFHVKDLPVKDNIDDKTSTPTTTMRNANDFTTGGRELYKPYDYTSDEKESTTSEKYRYLFEPVPNYDSTNHEGGPQVTLPRKNGGHQKPSSLKKSDEKKPKSHGNQKSKTSKEKEQESRPRKIQIVKTFDIMYTAHGNMPVVNKSFKNLEAIYKKYSNLKKRNSRKSYMASTTLKTPILSKPPRQKRLTGYFEDGKHQEVYPNVTLDEGEMVDKRQQNKNRDINEKHLVKNVTALEVLMDMMKNNDGVQQTSVEKPPLKGHNSVQVHLSLPENVKRSLKRFRKIFTARLFSPVDLEYEIHSYDDSLDTTTLSVLPSGMYLLVDKYNATSPRGLLMLRPISNDLSLSGNLQRQFIKFAANPDLENKKVEETTQNVDKFSKVTLSKEFVSAINEHLVQLYQAFAKNDTKMDETTPQLNKVTLNSDIITVNIQRPEGLQETGDNHKLKLHKREIKKIKNTFPSKDAIKKAICENKECNGKRKVLFEFCPVNDEVMLELVAEMNDLVEYMNEHCTEIQTYFRNNPSGGRKLRDTVRKVNKLIDTFSKTTSTLKSYYCPFDKIVGKRHIAELVDAPQKYVPSNLIDDIERLASDISNATKFRIRFNEKLYNRRNNLVGAVDKCVLGDDNRNERSVTKNDKDVYSLDKVKVNIICKTKPSSTTLPQQQPNQLTVHWLVDNINDQLLNKRQWSLKNLLLHNKHMNKKSRDLMSRSWKREVTSIGSPLIADSGGSFWSNYMHKFQKASHFEKKCTSEETSVTVNNEKQIHPIKEASTKAGEITGNANVINKCSKENNEITTSTEHQLINETSSNTGEVNVLPISTPGTTNEPENSVARLVHSNGTNTNEYLNGKKERKIKPKHKEKHTKWTDTTKPIANKSKNTVTIDNPVFNEDDDINTSSVPPTLQHVTNTNSNSTQSTSINSNKDADHVNEVKVNNTSTFYLKQLLKRIPGYNTSRIHDKEKYKNADVATGPVIPSSTANITGPTTSIVTARLERDQIKTGARSFQQWGNDNIVKYTANENSEEAQEPINYNLSNESQTTENSLKHDAGKPDDDFKLLLLSILQYETKRMNNDTVLADNMKKSGK